MKRYLAPLGAILLILAGTCWAQTRTKTQQDVFTDFTGGLSPVGSVRVTYCGENAENGTIYFSPIGLVFTEPVIGDTTCDALDGATEATQDVALTTTADFRPVYMRCSLQGTLGAGESISFQLRHAEADFPGMGCTVTSGTLCDVRIPGRNKLFRSIPTAMKVTQVSDNADDNGKCVVIMAID